MVCIPHPCDLIILTSGQGQIGTPIGGQTRTPKHSSNTLSVAMRLLGISRPILYSLMQTHGIESELAKGGHAAEDVVAGIEPGRASPSSAPDDMPDSDRV
jgi:hypothetical protein